ncbi:hypothetical protein Focb16_v005961 [Fusarium oxysporum f. sp. cubense]|uniref:Rhodopsin domain-containing protein n=1 Tax=Fusarium oxysporum f. sp. cubense TaxID=61366 RepID=A0A559LK83_FUSOC|nr:hypothetical protein Focb16_v005961 [Fusarium oxysporum f. sp. cubense]
MYSTGQDIDVALPALEPPKGVMPDFDNPPNHNGQALVSIFVFAACSVLLDLLRTYWKMWWNRKRTWSYLAFAISEVLNSCALVTFCASVYELYKFSQSPGYDVHTWNLRMSELVEPLEFQRVYQSLSLAILACIKIAIQLEHCQVLADRISFKKLLWSGSLFIILLQVIYTLVIVGLVNRKRYDHNNIGEFCKNKPRCELFAIIGISEAIQLFTGLLMVALPQCVIWRMKIGWKQKLQPALAFGSGVIPCTVGFVSLVLTVIYSRRADYVWCIGRLQLLKNAEIACWFVYHAAKCVPQIVKEVRESLGRQKSVTGIPSQSSNKDFELENGLVGTESKESLWDSTL